jgi:hypothetical protein
MLILVNLRFNSATDKVTLVASGAAAGVGAKGFIFLKY